MAPTRRAWTLLETLVSVAVLATLVGILLPTLSRSITQARQASCIAAIRGYTQAVHAYAADANDYPPAMPIVYPDDQFTWPDNFQQVRYPLPRGGFGQVHYAIQGWRSIYILLDSGYLPYEAALCPSQRRHADPSGQNVSDHDSSPTYAIPETFYFPPSVYDPATPARSIASPFRTQRLTSVRYPSRKSLIFEYKIWHLRQEPTIQTALTQGDAPSIATTDGRAMSWNLTGTPVTGTNTALGYSFPAPWLNPQGIAGIDIE